MSLYNAFSCYLIYESICFKSVNDLLTFLILFLSAFSLASNYTGQKFSQGKEKHTHRSGFIFMFLAFLLQNFKKIVKIAYFFV